MKQLARLTMMALIMTLSFNLTAQQNRLTAGIWVHAVNPHTSDYITPKNWQFMFPKVTLSVPISNRFSVMPAFSYGKISDATYWDFDASIKYDITQTRLQPYLIAGVGLSSIASDVNTMITPGFGLKFWITDNFGISAQTNFDWLPKEGKQDYYHNAYGLVFRFGKNGPKDSDKDGVPDEKDLCPKLAGTVAAGGCPDRDGDGVKDTDDKCPDAFGTAATNGCPDKDGDGIADAEDACPAVAGVAKFKGCPDSDNDGITDAEDACPNEKGLAALKGCPDKDGDGVADKEDKCPDQAGVASLGGCPDKDGDGIADGEDACPDVKGVKANKGCPEIKEEEVKAIETKLNISAKRIQFETGSDKIKPASFTEIDQIVSIMNQYTFTEFSIDGYTDNTGKLETNQALSQKRADAVKDYIVNKGIASGRLSSTGHGPDQPIASNNTAAGRAQNRRVEIHLKK